LADQKNMTLRLSAVQADELEAVARTEGISVSDAVKEAITEHIDRKRKDKAFVSVCSLQWNETARSSSGSPADVAS
jgi:hypothetical protein